MNFKSETEIWVSFFLNRTPRAAMWVSKKQADCKWFSLFLLTFVFLDKSIDFCVTDINYSRMPIYETFFGGSLLGKSFYVRLHVS